MNPQLPIVTIIGRPNVGKSALFNRLYGQRRAIVDATSGVTRDRLSGVVDWEGVAFELIDTGGITFKSKNKMDQAITEQAKKALDSSDLLLFVTDSLIGPVAVEYEIAQLVRKSSKKVILIVNKVDSQDTQIDVTDFYGLGLGEPVPISALHGTGSGDLLSAINQTLGNKALKSSQQEPIKVAIVGRPNVGKSSFYNALLGEERVIVDDKPGTTRDAIDTLLTYQDLHYRIIDTAGLIHPRKTKDQVEFYSSNRSIKTIRKADIVLCMIDSFDGVRQDDLRIFEEANKAYCGAIIVANKWDLTKGIKTENYIKRIHERANFMRYAPVYFTQAVKKVGIFQVLKEVGAIYYRSVQKFPTPLLNDILEAIKTKKSHPISGTKKVKFSYISQTGVAPLILTIFTNFPEAVNKAYMSFFEKELRKKLDLSGVPLRFIFKKKKRAKK